MSLHLIVMFGRVFHYLLFLYPLEKACAICERCGQTVVFKIMI